MAWKAESYSVTIEVRVSIPEHLIDRAYYEKTSGSQKIAAIKAVREYTNKKVGECCGLKDAKEIVEDWMRAHVLD